MRDGRDIGKVCWTSQAPCDAANRRGRGKLGEIGPRTQTSY